MTIINSIPPSDINPVDLVTSVNVEHVDEEFSFQKLNATTVGNAMASLTKKKGRDIYELNLSILVIVQDLITPVLATLFNICFLENVFSDCLKLSLIHPVFKKGDKTQVSITDQSRSCQYWVKYSIK